MYVVVIKVTDDVNVILQYVIVINCNSAYKSCQLQQRIKMLSIPIANLKAQFVIIR